MKFWGSRNEQERLAVKLICNIQNWFKKNCVQKTFIKDVKDELTYKAVKGACKITYTYEGYNAIILCGKLIVLSSSFFHIFLYVQKPELSVRSEGVGSPSSGGSCWQLQSPSPSPPSPSRCRGWGPRCLSFWSCHPGVTRCTPSCPRPKALYRTRTVPRVCWFCESKELIF